MDSQPEASTSALPASGEERQIAIRLSTKDSLYSIPATKFLVPASWRRFHLSELINKVLENCKCLPPSAVHSSVVGGKWGKFASAVFLCGGCSGRN